MPKSTTELPQKTATCSYWQQRTSSCDRRCRVVIVLAEPPASASTSSTAIWLMYPFQMPTACGGMSTVSRQKGQLCQAEATPCGVEHVEHDALSFAEAQWAA